MKPMRVACTIFALFLVGPTFGCNTPEPRSALSYTANAKKAYEEALASFESHDWLECQQLFRDVKRKYPYTKYARMSELRIADADFEQEKFTEAVRGYRQFVHDHRGDTDDVAYARSKIAEAEYKQIGETFLLASADERDQIVVLTAFRELKSFLHDYPDQAASGRIRELLSDVTARLIRHELYVARYYLSRDNFEAAASRARYALSNYAVLDPDGHEPETLVLLGEVYLKMKNPKAARTAFESVLKDYPKSALTEQARNFLSYMASLGV